MHPALKQAPKSKSDVAKRIHQGLLKGKIAARFNYSKASKVCVIGIFFTPEQLAYIKDKKEHPEYFSTANDLDVYDLSNHIGPDNIEAMTGMTLYEANKLQDAWDNGDPTTFDNALTGITQVKTPPPDLKVIRKSFKDFEVFES